MPVKPQFMFFVFIVAVLASYGSVRAFLAKNPRPLPHLPAVAFYDKLGHKVTLDDFKGQVVLVNVWATWCPPCVAELPSLDRLQKKESGGKFRVVAISTDTTSQKKIMDFLHAHNISHLAFYWDKDGQIPLRWHYAGLPTSFLLDRRGNTVARFDGPYVWDSGASLQKIKDLISR